MTSGGSGGATSEQGAPGAQPGPPAEAPPASSTATISAPRYRFMLLLLVAWVPRAEAWAYNPTPLVARMPAGMARTVACRPALFVRRGSVCPECRLRGCQD